MRYRAEIDGLRAVAVAPVILFHAGFTSFNGGYAGVDIFFVISGFLITGILIEGMKAGTFTFAGFYERRARRILPALFLVIACTLPFGWMWMFPPELEELSASIVSVAAFVSNIFFWWQSGYFATAAETKPLLHTWTLAVEEQFYILFPIVLLALRRYGDRVVVAALVAAFVVSLALSEYASRYHSSFNFFWAPTRAWELLAGSLCAYARIPPVRQRDNALSLFGLVLIAGSLALLDPGTRFPSLLALPVVAGTCLVLLFAVEGTVVARLLSVRLLVGIGLVSYSAYLWHQPLFALARVRMVLPPPSWVMAALCLLKFVLALASYRLIELPLRERGPGAIAPRRAFVSVVSAVGVLLAAFGASTYAARGYPGRVDGTVGALLAGASDVGAYRAACLGGAGPGRIDPSGPCRLGAPGKPIDFVLIGDSFAGALADGLSVAAQQRGRAGVIAALHGCPPIIGTDAAWAGAMGRCKTFQGEIVETVRALGVKDVVLHARWDVLDQPDYVRRVGGGATTGHAAFEQPLLRTIEQLTQTGARVHIVCCVPKADHALSIPLALAKQALLSDTTDLRPELARHLEKNASALRLFAGLAARGGGGRVVDITSALCGTDRCNLVHEGHPLYFDGGPNGGHLSKYGSVRLAPALDAIFDDVR